MNDKKNQRQKKFNVLIDKAACPSCGAEVNFASATSIMSVCSYCHTTVVRDSEAIRAQGKQSAVIEDYSPLQLGSYGVYDKRHFVLIGRLQLKYDDGKWNEWYVRFDNGETAWLSETLEQYSFTFNRGGQEQLPTYRQLQIGQTINYQTVDYLITDKRSAVIITGEGELPFMVDKGQQTWVIDAQYRKQFITLDYMDSGVSGQPTVYQGTTVPFSQLEMSLLRDIRQINNKELSDKSKNISRLNCPNCGSPIPYISGATNCLLCPACHSEVKLNGKIAELVTLHSMMQTLTTSLQLGEKARINSATIAAVSENNAEEVTTKDHDYIIIGIVKLKETQSIFFWVEYLLYSFTDGFLWLEETLKGWRVARVMSEFPVDKNKRWLEYQGKKWVSKYDEDYTGRVVYAVGAFNWQIRIGDTTRLTDFRCGNAIITKEIIEEEISYSLSVPLTVETLTAWFGRPLTTDTLSGLKKRQKYAKGIVIVFAVALSLTLIFTFYNINKNEQRLKADFAKNRLTQEESKKDCLKRNKGVEGVCDADEYIPYYSPVQDDNHSYSGRIGYSSSGSHK